MFTNDPQRARSLRGICGYFYSALSRSEMKQRRIELGLLNSYE
ncbi:hypothetical protein EDD59_10374 [Muricomes intestini]|jgi:hypothetical protein|uniref:Uncharacterized protein n=1 Tax=Muricomes intestini TaxID=1796634 RepID=A0A4R3KEK7_9FIRM|nr:hypothetical protein EDD59_10374 [Muricomes intestini]